MERAEQRVVTRRARRILWTFRLGGIWRVRWYGIGPYWGAYSCESGPVAVSARAD